MANHKRIRWGVLSTAKIAREKIIPAIHAAESSDVMAVASRSQQQAEEFAGANKIPVAYGDYQYLLDDPEIDAIYNPLPNHLHVPWTIKAIQAGKHVLCEKPLGLNAADVEKLLAIAKENPHLKVMEAFMYRLHPQWRLAKRLLEDGKIGKINSVKAAFTYHKLDADNIRNKAELGGGGLMDIGCYAISATRYLLSKEPLRVVSKLDFDPGFQVDRHAHAILDFGDAQATIYCSTQSESGQHVLVSGELGCLEIPMPFYQDNNCAARLIFRNAGVEDVLELEACNHYVKQVDAFANAIINDLPVPTGLNDALANMRVLDAVFDSQKQKGWVAVNPQ